VALQAGSIRLPAIEVLRSRTELARNLEDIPGSVQSGLDAHSDDFRATVDLAGGGQATRRIDARLGGSQSHFGWLVQGYQMATDGFKDLAEGGTGFQLGDYNGKFRVHSDPRSPTYQELEVKLGYYRQRSDETYLGLTDSDFALTRRPAAVRPGLPRTLLAGVRIRR
jgi:Fe(3+) dicitrate transport protein